MKKITLSLLALLLCIGLSAQPRVGIKGGLNFNSIKDVKWSSETIDNATGWHVGVVSLAKLPLGFAFQPELLYSVKNYGSKDSKFNLCYVEVPLNLQWGIDMILFRPFVMASPYISYLTSVGGEASKWKKDKKLNNFDYGFGLGFGLDLWKIQVTGKYNWGLGKLGNIKEDKWELNDSSLMGFQLSLALLF